jgi:N utilization substance protein A
MFDLKVINSVLGQLEEERGIPREKLLLAIEDALGAAYKKDYGKRGQIIRAKFDLVTGKTDFYRVKLVVDESMIRPDDEPAPEDGGADDGRVYWNDEHHLWLPDAQKIKADVKIGEELLFPLETKEDYGRIAAQTAKQVITQRLREAERGSILTEYAGREGDVISGTVQRVERGNVFIDLGRTTAILPREEQIPGEYYRQGERVKAYLISVDETPRGIDLRLSRSHPRFLEKLFGIESPEVASGTVVLAAIAREAGSRAKVAVKSTDQNIDPVGSLVGQRGIRVNTVINELGGEKIDIIPWSENAETFIRNSLSPAKILEVEVDEANRQAKVLVEQDQFSLAIGRGGQNVRLAAKLTGYRIDINSRGGDHATQIPESNEAPVIEKIKKEAETVVPEVSTPEDTPEEKLKE